MSAMWSPAMGASVDDALAVVAKLREQIKEMRATLDEMGKHFQWTDDKLREIEGKDSRV